jgi:hypothetical protein
VQFLFLAREMSAVTITPISPPHLRGGKTPTVTKNL